MRHVANSTAHLALDDASPGLVWVIVGGEPRHVSAFAELSPRRRPAARCPHCDSRVTLKLGDVRRHHAAHAPDHTCPATHPETALHLDCKLALASALRAAAGPEAALAIVRRCVGGAGASCDETHVAAWARAWDRVNVEHRLADSHRPDIVLCRGETPIAAIEIVVSHAVSPEKALALQALGVPWIEIAADEALTSPGAWRPSDPLPAMRSSGERVWRCRIHASLLRAARVVDVYHADGARERFIYRVTELANEGGGLAFRLQRGTIEVATVPAREAVRIAFTADVKRLSRDAKSFTDSPMRWASGGAAADIVEEALFDRVGPDPTPLATTYPRRWFYARKSGQWFLPPEMRDVRWDREPFDAFAAHPAWRQARMAVRERPSPEGSWRTPIFASRPRGTMFGAARPPRLVGETLAVVDISGAGAAERRAIVVVERATSADAIEELHRSLETNGVDAVWVSHPSDWTPAMAALVWAPGGRDQNGYGAMLIDGLGVFRAEHVARALGKHDKRFTAAAIRQAMAARVQRLQER